MAYIEIEEGLPGIRGLLAFRPETAKPLGDLADALLHAPGTLSPGDRELIAAHVSHLNECVFCHASHAAIAACHLQDEELVARASRGPENAEISDKLRALLALAARVQQGGRAVRPDDIARAREAARAEIRMVVRASDDVCMLGRRAPSQEILRRDRAV